MQTPASGLQQLALAPEAEVRCRDNEWPVWGRLLTVRCWPRNCDAAPTARVPVGDIRVPLGRVHEAWSIGAELDNLGAAVMHEKS